MGGGQPVPTACRVRTAKLPKNHHIQPWQWRQGSSSISEAGCGKQPKLAYGRDLRPRSACEEQTNRLLTDTVTKAGDTEPRFQKAKKKKHFP